MAHCFVILNGIGDCGTGNPSSTVRCGDIKFCKKHACAVLSIQFFERITDAFDFFEKGFIEVGLLIVLRHNEEIFAP